MSSEIWQWIDSGIGASDYNMAMDQALMDLAPQTGCPVLRFYGWREKAATFGYSQHYADIELLTPLRPLIRRPTGGGLVPHNADWTYSLAFPPGHWWYQLKAVESYERVHQWIRDAFAAVGVETSLAPAAVNEGPGQCFIGAEKSDLLWRGRKIAGAAQRRSLDGLLIQGSVQPPPLKINRAAWQTAVLDAAQKKWGVCWTALGLDGLVAVRAGELARTKYSQAAFNRRR